MASTLQSQLKITLFRGWEAPSAYVWSPFVTKLEARLRFAGVPYRTEGGNPTKAPRGKIPYVAVSRTDNGAPVTLLSDSDLIIEKWIEDGVLENLNAKLQPTGKAHDLAFRAMLEEKLYFYQGPERWHDNYYTMRSQILANLPYPFQVVVGLLIYRKTTQTMYGQGTGRFSGEELHRFKEQIWESVNVFLVESRKKMMEMDSDDSGNSRNDAVFWLWGGDNPTEADAVLFGFVAAVLVCKANPESRKIIKSFPAVVDYARRIHQRHFPDYVCWE